MNKNTTQEEVKKRLKQLKDAIQTNLDHTPITPEYAAWIAYLKSYIKDIDQIIAINRTKPDSKMNEEQLILLLSLFKHGIDIFGSNEDFYNWLRAENVFFDGKTPISFLNTVTGIRFVNDRLTALE